MRLIYPLLLNVLLSFGVWDSRTASACTGSCATDADCSANSCHYCETDFGRCADCCEYTEAVTCPSACTWDSGSSECRNYAGTPCGVDIPELPGNFRITFFGLLSLSIALATFISGVAIYRRRRKTRPAK